MRQRNRQQLKRVEFEGGQGCRLAGVLHRPRQEAGGQALVLAHSFTSSKNLKIIARLAGNLAEEGCWVLRFDFTGLGQSRGRFEETTVTSHIQDLKAALDFMNRQGYPSCSLAGHSLGGALAILTAAERPEVRSVAAVSAPSDVAHLKRLFPPRLREEIQRRGSAAVPISGRPIRIGRDFLDDLDRHHVLAAVSKLSRPFLVVHGLRDQTVPIPAAEALFQAAQQPKSFFALPQGDHLLADPGQAAKVSAIVSLWLKNQEGTA